MYVRNLHLNLLTQFFPSFNYVNSCRRRRRLDARRSGQMLLTEDDSCCCLGSRIGRISVGRKPIVNNFRYRVMVNRQKRNCFPVSA